MALRFLGRLKGLSAELWRGKPGQAFRSTLAAGQCFAEQHELAPDDLGDHLSAAVKGLANKDLARAANDFAEAEQKRAETALRMQGAEAELRRKEAEADKARAEAEVAKLAAIERLVDLSLKMQAAGVAAHFDAAGHVIRLEAVADADIGSLLNLEQPTDQSALPETGDSSP